MTEIKKAMETELIEILVEVLYLLKKYNWLLELASYVLAWKLGYLLTLKFFSNEEE